MSEGQVILMDLCRCCASASTVHLFLILSGAATVVAPFAPVGTPGRLPDVLSSSVDNIKHQLVRSTVDNDDDASARDGNGSGSGSGGGGGGGGGGSGDGNDARSHLKAADKHRNKTVLMPINITALIIASTLARFERAASEVRKSDIHSTVWIPAIFLNEANYSMCGGGGNGLRHAMRNAWNLIASAGVGMAVFEEDVRYAGEGRNISVSEHIVRRCLQRTELCDLAYLGEWNNFFTTHAIYVPPATARKLLDMTSDCYPFGVQIDQGMHARCLHRPNRPKWNCVHPPAFRVRGGFGVGFFVQDPQAVPPTLHNRGSNRPIAR